MDLAITSMDHMPLQRAKHGIRKKLPEQNSLPSRALTDIVVVVVVAFRSPGPTTTAKCKMQNAKCKMQIHTRTAKCKMQNTKCKRIQITNQLGHLGRQNKQVHRKNLSLSLSLNEEPQKQQRSFGIQVKHHGSTSDEIRLPLLEARGISNASGKIRKSDAKCKCNMQYAKCTACSRPSRNLAMLGVKMQNAKCKMQNAKCKSSSPMRHTHYSALNTQY